MTVESELERMVEEVALVCFKLQSLASLGGTKEKYRKHGC
jgi:hypothetical protein